MRVPGLASLLWLLASAAMGQNHVDTADPSPCFQAAATAELEEGLPSGLLAAIGRVESGRWNSRTSRVEPWPWTVNAAGAGRYHPILQDALADVAREQAAGVRSVDVGCFQVNLLHHPTAFANLNEAFDPLANARYAARFLNALRTRTGAWDLAVAQYHSASPGIGELYRQRVMATWQGGILPTPTVARRSYASAAQAAPQHFAASADPHVIFVRTSAAMNRGGRRDLEADPHVIRIRS